MLQTSVQVRINIKNILEFNKFFISIILIFIFFQTSIKESSAKIEKSQAKIMEVAQNLTNRIESHTHLLEKVRPLIKSKSFAIIGRVIEVIQNCCHNVR